MCVSICAWVFDPMFAKSTWSVIDIFGTIVQFAIKVPVLGESTNATSMSPTINA